MTNVFLNIGIALFGGFALGLFYFYSLWITVRQFPVTAYPIPLAIGSFFGRLIITLLGFYILMDGQWQRGLSALLGFIIARTVITRIKGKLPNSHPVETP
ncbi:ATP synthase subunit I [Baaleninema sp.]|uniref:N-ATPase subunit AtpR n=1 Tax=Baaleninema sp. TaxID=3101197 RepID=UPI003D073906